MNYVHSSRASHILLFMFFLSQVRSENLFFDWVGEKGNIKISYNPEEHLINDDCVSNIESDPRLVPYSCWRDKTFVCLGMSLSQCLQKIFNESLGSRERNDTWQLNKTAQHLFIDSKSLKDLPEVEHFAKELKLIIILATEELEVRNLIRLLTSSTNLKTIVLFTINSNLTLSDHGFNDIMWHKSKFENLILHGLFNPSCGSLIEFLKPKFLSTRDVRKFDPSKFGNLPEMFLEMELGKSVENYDNAFSFLRRHKIKKIGMAESNLREIPEELTLLEDSLLFLTLAKNDLSSMDKNTESDVIFPRMSRLLELDLRFCKISALTSFFFKELPELKAVSLSGNYFFQPSHQFNFTFVRDDFIFLNMSFNPISSNILVDIKYDNDHLRSVLNSETNKFLDLSYTDIRDCDLPFKSANLNITHLSIISSNRCFKSLNFSQLHSLEAIDASGNINSKLSSQTITDRIRTFFLNISKVKKLLFRGNNLDRVSSINAYKMFSNFPNLEYLHLGKNRLRKVPNALLELRALVYLNLSDNFIKTWNTALLQNSQPVMKVDLSDNQIQFITGEMEEDFLKLGGINLRGNPLACTDRLWRLVCFPRTRNESVIILNTEETTCIDETSGVNRILDSATNEQCEQILAKNTPNDQVVWIMAFTSVVVILCVTWNWSKIYNYAKFHTILKSISISSVSKRDIENCEFRYDVFVSYSELDRDWVLQNLIPYLETTSGMNICLHDRDFQIGMGILENIVECMDKSHCILLVISKSFVKSKWCQFEMHLGQYFMVETNKPNLILILLEDIPRSMRPKVLHYLMKTRTYIEWQKHNESDKSIEESIFFKRLAKALKCFKDYQSEFIQV